MALALDRHNNGPEFETFNNRLKDKDGIPIGIAANNPIINTRMYEAEYIIKYSDRYETAMTANTKASNLFSKFNQNGQHFLLFDAIIYARTNGT